MTAAPASPPRPDPVPATAARERDTDALPGVRVGLEVHVYLKTRAKLFCADDADFLSASSPNRSVCPVCTGQPGSKPMAPNAAAVEAAARVATALGSRLAPHARFLRKHYFYPDLPTNYQRTSEPVGVGGELAGVRITEMHLEEDPGSYDLKTGGVDYNRCGAPLLEIVTEPDIKGPEHATEFLGELRLILAYLGVWREDAGVKADVNVSVSGGERTEVKNVNSMRNVERAIRHEIERQRTAHARGEPNVRETRHFDEESGRTVRLRAKESAADYRFIPDPDLAPFKLLAPPAQEAPLARRARLAAAIGVADELVSPLLTDRALVDALEAAAKTVPVREAYEFFIRDLRAELDYRKQAFAQARVTGEEITSLLAALTSRKITAHVATRLLRHGLDAGGLSAELKKELAAGVADEGLAPVAREVVAENPKAVQDFKAGKATAVNFLVGQLMRKTKGRAAPDAAREAIEAALAQASRAAKDS